MGQQNAAENPQKSLEVKHVLGDGDLVAVHSWVRMKPSDAGYSIIELGLYDSTLKIYKELTDQGIEPHSDQWKAEIECKLNRHKEAMKPRLYPEIPPHATRASIPWTVAAEKTRTGTHFQSKSVRGR